MWRKEARDPEMSAEHRGAALRYKLRGQRDGWRDGRVGDMCVCNKEHQLRSKSPARPVELCAASGLSCV